MRDHAKLDAIAETLNWPAEYDYVRSLARGLHTITPDNTPTWLAEKVLQTIPTFTCSKVAPNRLTCRRTPRRRSLCRFRADGRRSPEPGRIGLPPG